NSVLSQSVWVDEINRSLGSETHPFQAREAGGAIRLFYGFSNPLFTSIGGANEQPYTGAFRALSADPRRVLFVPAGTRRALPGPEGAVLRSLASAPGDSSEAPAFGPPRFGGRIGRRVHNERLVLRPGLPAREGEQGHREQAVCRDGRAGVRGD